MDYNIRVEFNKRKHQIEEREVFFKEEKRAKKCLKEINEILTRYVDEWINGRARR